MAEWYDVSDVRFVDLISGSWPHAFTLYLTGEKEGERVDWDIKISEDEFLKQMNEFGQGKRLRCHFSFGRR